VFFPLKKIDYQFCLRVTLQPIEYLEVAEKAANFIKEKLYDASSKRLHHSYRNGPSKAPGFLDDYAFLINGLLDLYEFGGKIEWLLWAIQLQVTQASLYIVHVTHFDVHHS
jgi:uncharacterized protein YyaL (SSP411 family)